LSGNGNKTSRSEAMTTANPEHFDTVPRRGGRHFLGTRGDNPKISVLTVVRNGAATLSRAIESVVGQLNDDIEYVIVDGASTDSTLEIIKAYEDRIAFWVSEPDHGIYDAMNKALAFARGDWIIFLGADDQLNPVLQDIAGELRDTDAVYYGSVERTVAGGVRGGRFSRYRLMQETSVIKLSSIRGAFTRPSPTTQMLACWLITNTTSSYGEAERGSSTSRT
jgi:glycosyltransferase involved in cell wall biosynthesis